MTVPTKPVTTRDIAVTVLRKPVTTRDNNVTDIMSVTGFSRSDRGHPVNVPIRRMMHLSSVIPANDTRESMFGQRNFPRPKRGSNLGPLAPEASA